MKFSAPVIVGLIIVAIVVVYFVLGSGPGPYDDFAKCLSDKGVKMYGAFWCPHCKNQKELFGSSWKYVEYVECSLPDGSGQTAACNQAGIKGYPTWEFGDGKRVEGEMTFADLGRFSGCAAPAK